MSSHATRRLYSFSMAAAVGNILLSALCMQQLHAVGPVSTIMERHCSFPIAWYGTWYEADSNYITITATDVIGRGTCVESNDNCYLLENRDLSCYQCLVISERHTNVLQYKQSFCVDRDSLYNICTSIHGETIYRTLVRDPSTAVACPFHDAYHFIYANNSGGFCTNPVSYIKPCASTSNLVFNFRHCSDAAYSYNQEWGMECVATWRDGAQSYLIARLLTSTPSPASVGRFRCFIYRTVGTVVQLAMSADDSCRGLRSARDGPVVLELTQDTFSWPKSHCTFPAFVTRGSWRDLASTTVYRANDIGDVINVFLMTSRSSNYETSAPIRRLFCSSLSESNSTGDLTIVEAFSIDGCLSQFICMKFIKKVDGVLEITEGKRTDHASGQSTCSTMHTSTSQQRRLLITEVVTARACPLEGSRFPLLRTASDSFNNGCETFLQSGCNGTSLIEVTDSCSPKPVLQLECLRKWRTGRQRYVVARLLGDYSGYTACYSFRRKSDVLLFSTDTSCNDDRQPNHVISYALNSQALKCDTSAQSDDVIETGVSSSLNVISDDDMTESAHGGDLVGRHSDPTKRSRDYRTSLTSFAASYTAIDTQQCHTVLLRLLQPLAVILANICCSSGCARLFVL